MKILLVNDDGYGTFGIEEVRRALKNYGEVFVFAPSEHHSGASTSISYYRGLSAHKIDDHNYKVDGTPVDCVVFAIGVLGKENIDLVVSGANDGWNISLDTMYSGTCGAACEATMQELKSIALSCETFKGFKPDKIYKSTIISMDYILKNNLLSNKYYLNVNFESLRFDSPKGILLTRLFRRHPKRELLSLGNDNYSFPFDNCDIHDNDNFDVSAVYNGYISITPMNVSTFKEEDYQDLINKVNK